MIEYDCENKEQINDEIEAYMASLNCEGLIIDRKGDDNDKQVGNESDTD